MAAIEITPIGEAHFEVEVHEGGESTSHEVEVPAGYAEELGLGDVALQTLVHESFRFLLEHEPKEQILGRFALPVIARYFPSYADEIGARVRRRAEAEEGAP